MSLPMTHPRRFFWVVLAIAVVARGLLLPIPNTDNDAVFQTWSRIVTVDGFHTIYDAWDPVDNPDWECQYPPAYLYVLWAVGNVYQQLFSPEFTQESILFLMLLRLPTVLADLLLGGAIFLAIRRWWGDRPAHLAFAAHVLSPVMILDSTIVTQIDAVQALLMVGTVLCPGAGSCTACSAGSG